MRYTVITDPESYEMALEQARGTYQRNVLRGVESITGSTIEDRNNLVNYRRSREALLARLKEHEIETHRIRGEGNRELLVIGPLPEGVQDVPEPHLADVPPVLRAAPAIGSVAFPEPKPTAEEKKEASTLNDLTAAVEMLTDVVRQMVPRAKSLSGLRRKVG